MKSCLLFLAVVFSTVQIVGGRSSSSRSPQRGRSFAQGSGRASPFPASSFRVHRLKLLVAERETGDIADVLTLTAVKFEVKDRRDLFLETFNGSFSYERFEDAPGEGEIVEIGVLECDGEFKRKHPQNHDENQVILINQRRIILDWGLRILSNRPAQRTQPTLPALFDKAATLDWTPHEPSNDTDTAFFAFALLSVQNSKGSLYENPVFRGHLSSLSDVSTFLDSSCKIRIRKHTEQTIWPLRSVVDVSGRRISSFEFRTEIPTNAYSSSKTIHHAVVEVRDLYDLFPDTSFEEDHGNAVSYLDSFYPEVSSSWHPYVPFMPKYCGLENGSVSLADVQKLQIHHETSFIETHVRSIPGVDQILDLTMNILMPPIMDPFNKLLSEHTGTTLGSETSHESNSQTPWEASVKISQKVRYNLVNVLPDLMAAHLARSVTSTLTMEMGPEIIESVAPKVTDVIVRDVTRDLMSSVPRKIASSLPMLLERSLTMTLTRELTRTLTHSLTPTLTFGLSRNPDERASCDECARTGVHCEKCQSTSDAQRYRAYVGTYYSDYYAEWYQKYYYDQLLALDKKQHGGTDHAKNAKKHNEGEADFSKPLLWQRPLSASGMPPNEQLGAPLVGARKEIPQVMDPYVRKFQYWAQPDSSGDPQIQGNLWGNATHTPAYYREKTTSAAGGAS